MQDRVSAFDCDILVTMAGARAAPCQRRSRRGRFHKQTRCLAHLSPKPRRSLLSDLYCLTRSNSVAGTQFPAALPARNDFSRNHAVGQASRLSLTLNDRLEAWFPQAAWQPPKNEARFLDGDRRDAWPTQAGARRRVIGCSWFRFIATHNDIGTIIYRGQGRARHSVRAVVCQAKCGARGAKRPTCANVVCNCYTTSNACRTW